tara:strand:+ start:108 stop:1292 length:1185 start_codon:yes stop_codon:yes gene_type:complete
MKKPELLVPVNSLAGLKAAEDAGADSVYFGISIGINMRNSNLSINDIEEIKKSKVKKYLTLNSIINDGQLETIENTIIKTKDFIDGYICWDLAVIQLLKKYNCKFVVSTQANITNSETAKFYKELGAGCIVLARELTLEQIKSVKEKVDIPIEVFIHGSMCMAYSGRCFLSQDVFNRSANRGRCQQQCRREYLVKDNEGGQEYIMGEDYIMNAKDLCTMGFIDKLIESKIDIFKVEGRNKKEEYVKVVTEAYREAIDAYFEGKLTENLKKKLIKKLETVYNRGFDQGFFFGKSIDSFSKSPGNKSSKVKVFIGKITNYYVKVGVGLIDVQAHPLKVGDTVLIKGNKTGIYETKIEEMEVEHKKIKEIKKGMVGVKLDRVRIGDEVYLFKDRDVV